MVIQREGCRVGSCEEIRVHSVATVALRKLLSCFDAFFLQNCEVESALLIDSKHVLPLDTDLTLTLNAIEA